ncbi:MAG: signal peptidase I [Sporichthyaceae bacterium]|nr:signal peptidase I [Sporichthyaceae bacterium]
MLVGIAIILALLIKTFLVQAFYIPSDSMENTLLRGDRVLVNKLGARFGGPDRGEVIVFRDPGGWLSNGGAGQPSNPIVRGIKKTLVFIGLLPSDSQQDLIKRVIGLPGDRVACCDSQGRVTVNGQPLGEPYVFPGNPPSDTTFDVTVPPGRLWVMGDHRSVSADSRVHMAEAGEGTIPMDNVVGRAFVVVWPLGRAGGLGVPSTFEGDRLDQAGSETGPQSPGTESPAPESLAVLSPAAASAASVPPLLWGFAGAVPLVAIRRRWRHRRFARS